ncbi:MAG: DUF3459 domain-containing protein [Chloroflexi bacterium]|nr:DUF3459 domain-containing protein [Chloroflexota bacterium]MBU1751185.1 DUF3459 domain-containing protein [Chloroflexota bacterium]MBU1877987.1 DUF3459 domain-containing protein [Chloroflexota bacterium]
MTPKRKTAPDAPWWRDGVIYQVYPRSFADSNGDGVGDLPGLIAHLDYLAGADAASGDDSLGIDAIWLSPVYPSPMYDFGYDVSDYCGIDPLFGTLDDFDRLVKEAHRRGIRIVMDLVLNHTSHQHPWFVESRSSRDNPRRDWYIWRDGQGDRPPNNWQSVFGGPAWEWDERTAQYYLHLFLKEQPDLNWRNPAVQDAMWDVFRFWLDRGVDGFRLDVFNLYVKDAQLRDNPLRLGLRAYDRQIHIQDRDQPEMHPLLRDLRALLDDYPQRMAVGETFSEEPVKMAAAYYGQQNDELNLSFNFDFTHQPWRARAFYDAIARWEAALPPGAWPCHVLSNHDVERHASRYAAGSNTDVRAKVAAALLLTIRGTPFLYYGEELAMRQGRIARAQIQDPPGKRYWPLYKGRDGCRTPMPWDDSPHAGFSINPPWLPVNADYRQRNVEAQRRDPDSVFHWYRRLIALRKASPALRRGDYVPLIRRPVHALAYLRVSPEQTLLVALNFASRPVLAVLDEPLPARDWQVLLSTADRPDLELLGNSLALAPYEACVLGMA